MTTNLNGTPDACRPLHTSDLDSGQQPNHSKQNPSPTARQQKSLTMWCLVVLFTLLASLPSLAQTTYTWASTTAGGSWATGGNWSPTRTTPANNDVLVFNASSNITITAVPTQTIGRLRITGSGVVTLQSAGNITLTVQPGGTSPQVDIAAGGLIVNGITSNSINLTVASGNTMTTATGTSLAFTNLATLTNNGVTFTQNGVLYDFQSGSTYAHPINQGTIPLATWNANSTVTLTGMTNGNGSGLANIANINQAFGNLTVACSQTTDLSLNVNSSFSVAGTFLVNGNTSGSAGTQYNGNGTRYALKLISSVASGSVSISLNNVTISGSTNVCLVVFSDAPASSSNTVTVNVTGTITLGNNSNQARLIYVGNTAPATITCTGTALTNIGNNGTLVFLDHGNLLNGCNVTVTMLSSISTSTTSSQLWPLRAYANAASNGSSNSVLNATIGSFTTPCTITNQGTSGFNILAQNSGSAANQSNNQVTFNVYGNVVQNSSNNTFINPTDRSDASRQVVTLNIYKTTGGLNGNLTISNGNVSMGLNNNVLASLGNRAFLNVEGNINNGTITSSNNRNNMVGQVRVFGSTSQIGATGTVNFQNAIDLIIDNGTGNSTTLGNNISLTSGYSYLKLLSGNLNLNGRTFSVGANTWVFKSLGTISATPSYTAPINYYYIGTTTTGPELSTSFNAGTIVIASGANITSGGDFRFQTRFVNKGTFTQSTSFTTTSVNSVTLTDSAAAGTSTTFGNLASVNTGGSGNWINDLSFTVAGNWASSVTAGDLALLFIKGNTVTSRTMNVVGNFTIGVGTRFDMTSSSSPTLTSNGPDHSLVIGGNFTYNNGNDICRFAYINGNFIQAVNVTIGGTGTSAFGVASLNSTTNHTYKNLTFTGSGTVSTTNFTATIYGSISNTANTGVTFSGGRANFAGGPYGLTQTLGTSGGGILSLFNVTMELSETVVSMLQNISISGTGTSDLWHSCAFGMNSASTNPVFRVNSFNLTFNATANSNVFVLPNLASFNAGTGTVTFDVPTGVQASIAFSVNFNNVVVTNSGGTVANGATYSYGIAGDLTCNSILNLANNSATVTFTKAGTQTITGTTGSISLRTVVINSGATVNASHSQIITVFGAFTNNGIFNQTLGTFATNNVSGVTDSRSSNNTTFYNLAFNGNGAVCTWDMSCTISNDLSFASAGSGCNVNMAITGTPDYIRTKNIVFYNGNNGYGLDLTANTRTLATNLAHTLEVNGAITHASSSFPNLVCIYNNSGFTNALNVLLKSTTATNSIDLSSNNMICYLNNLTVDAASQFPISGLINGRLYGTINNASNNNFLLTNGRISTYLTGATISNTGSALLQIWNLTATTGTLNFVGAILHAGNATGSNNFQGAIDIQSAATLALGNSTLTTIGAGGTYRFAGALTAGTSTWIFANTSAPEVLTDNNMAFNNVTLALNGPSTVNLSRDNRVFTFNGTVEASTFQFTAASGSNSASFVINGLFRTANLNGLITNSSSSISTTNAPGLTLGASSTIEYHASTGTQTVSALTPNGYFALNLTNGGTKQAAGSFNIQGGSSMNINAGVSFDAATFTLGRTGAGTANFLINGTFQTGNANGFNAAAGSISNSNTAITQGASSIIEYTGLVAQSVTLITSPSQNYLNLRLSNNIGLSLAANTVIETSLTLNGGSLTLGNNDLTLGTSVSNLGTLTVNSGLLATTGTGRFIRWIGTTGLPTNTTSGIRFPVGTTSSDRSIYLAFSSSSALSAGGTIGVNHSLANGISAVGLPFADGTGGDLVNINFRTNAGWNFSTPSAPTLSGGESILVEARGSNIAAITTSSQARFVNVPGPAAGTSVNGAGTVTSPIAYRSNLSLANLTAAQWYIGSPTMQAVIVAVNGSAANWATNTTWSSNTVPTSTDYVVIPSSAAVVNLAGGTPYECLTLQVDQGANLNLSTNTLVPATGGVVNIFGTATTQNANGIALSPTASISSTNTPTISFGTTGTANYNGTGAQTISGIQYNNLTISTARSGSPSITLDGTNTIGITGALSITATGVGSYISTGNTINYNGSLTQTIPAFSGYNNLTSNNTGARILANSGNIDIAGTFTPGTNAYTITGSTVRFVSSSAQTIPAFNFQNITSTSTGTRTLASSGNIGIAGTFTPGSNAYTNAGSTVVYNGTGAQTVATFNYNNLTVNGGRGSNTVTIGATVGIAGALSLNNTVSYDFTNNSSTVNYNGVGNVSQTIIGGSYFTYNNLTISSALTGANTVTLDPVNPVRVRAFNPVANPGGSGYVVTGSQIQFTAGGATIPSFVYNNLATFNNAHTLPSGGNIEILGNWTSSTGLTLTPNTSTVKFSTASNITLPDAGPYFNLQITGAGIKTVGRVTIINNQLTLDNSYLSMGAGDGVEIGTSAASPGSLSVIGAAGIINNQGNNSPACYMLRWFGTSGLPTTFGNGGLFPIVRRYNNILSSRYFTLNFSSATALSTGGSVRVSYNNGSGVSQDGSVSFTQFADNSGPTVNLVRGAAYRWVVTTPSTPILAGGESMGLKLENGGSMRVSIPGNTRAIHVTGGGVYQQAPGTSQAGGGTQTDPSCSKSGLSIANLTANNWMLATDKLVGQVIASGVWSNTGIWLGGNIPGTTDDVFIPSPYDVSLVSNITLNSLDINSGASLSTNSNIITLGAGQTLTVGGLLRLAGPSLNQANNSALSTNNAPVLVLGPSSTVEYSSSGSQSVDNLNYVNLTMSNTGGRTFNGNVGVSGSFNLNGSNAFTTTGSTINFNGTTAITVPGFNYNNLTISGNKAANNVTFSGTVSMTGSFSPSATFSTGGYVVSGSTLEFTGTTASTVPAFTYNNLTLSGVRGSNNITLSGASTILGTFSPSATFGAGNYVTTGNTLTFDGTAAQTVPAFTYNNLSISGNRTSNNVTLTGAINIVGSFSPSATFSGGNYVVTGSTVNFNGTAAQIIPAFTYNNLTVSNARGSNNITLGAGTVSIAGDFVNTASFGAGTWVNTGNTVDMTGSGSQTLPGGGIILNNLSNSGNGNRTWAATTLNLVGTFSQGGGTYTAPVGSTVNYAGGNGQTIQPVNYYALTSTNNDRVLSATGVIGIAHNFTPGSGTYTATGSTVRFSGGNANIGGINGGFQNVTIETSGTKTLTSAASMLATSTLALNAGVLNNTSFGLTLGTGSTITRTTGSLSAAPTFGSAANITYLAGLSTGPELPTSSTVLQTLTINPGIGNAVTFGTGANPTVNTDLAIVDGKLAIGTNTLTLVATVSGSGNISGDATSNLTIAGTTGVNVGNLAFGPLTGDRQLNNLTINRNGGNCALTLSSNLAVAGTLAFGTSSTCKVQTGANTVDLGGTGVVTGEANGRYVVGNLSVNRTLNNGSNSFGNIGASMYCSNCNIGLTSVLRKSGSGTSVLSGLGTRSINRTYDIEPTSQPVVPVNLRLNWVSEDNYYNTPATNGRVWRSTDNGTTWTKVGTMQNFNNGYMDVLADHFSDWTVADANNPLPLELVSFSGSWIVNAAQLHWSTFSESNTSHFEVERSLDMVTYERVGIVAAAGNSASLLAYRHDDKTAKAGKLYYYRLKQVDADGQFTYSTAIRLNTGEGGTYSVYPNPATGHASVTLPSDAAGDYLITITDAVGKVVKTETLQNVLGATTTTLDLTGISQGIYVVSVSGSTMTATVNQKLEIR